MASSIVASSRSEHRDGLDAARALLGVSPKTKSPFSAESSRPKLANRKRVTFPLEHRIYLNPQDGHQEKDVTSLEPKAVIPLSEALREFCPPSTGGLDALAFLASREQASLQLSAQKSNSRHDQGSTSTTSSSSDDDSESMPPPPPRLVGRRRSMSNPEGMEKWDSLCESRSIRFVLPTSIIEEELAVCNAAIDEKAALALAKKNASYEEEATHGLPSIEEQEPDDSHLSPEELLRKARSRLLEDLSQSSISGDKGVLTLPHSLAKYKNVYNQNGRIGIYTPAERAAIISRFNRKRSKRVWNKKIRYNCRKNLADRRLRVKGRFVKRSAQLSFPISDDPGGEVAEELTSTEKKDETGEEMETDMPDTNDPDAGFCPTEDQPYRRLRRHTIT